ncbi:PspA-associated protein PspAA [Methanolobus halotolerans]|uniref:PspA-associated domain-containing protein n=1 Tax=Methanolobus halotolerans TaxID=2052935 RepID=A0A4E0PU97_9EURY|nr:hypothetical protein [Methanolobus halotolerans]TGC08519.1 hypothetical protein CUN85_09400 [Methanolobus halotolerans]
MIIRISEEGQYEVPSSLLDDLNTIDNKIVELVAMEKEGEYKAELSKLIKTIKIHGKKLDDSDIQESDIIVPPEDLTMIEARKIFIGDGLLED